MTRHAACHGYRASSCRRSLLAKEVQITHREKRQVIAAHLHLRAATGPPAPAAAATCAKILVEM